MRARIRNDKDHTVRSIENPEDQSAPRIQIALNRLKRADGHRRWPVMFKVVHCSNQKCQKPTAFTIRLRSGAAKIATRCPACGRAYFIFARVECGDVSVNIARDENLLTAVTHSG